MKKLARKILAAKVAVILAFTAGPGVMAPANASGIPVIDVANLSQTIMTATESVAQTLKQIEQYRTQLQQYENQLQNTLAPAAYIWDQANHTINEVMGAIDTLNYYKQQVGGIDQYLSKFQDVNYYKSSPCFARDGCTSAEWQAMRDAQRLGSEAQKKANDALFRGLDRQQEQLKADSRTLERLQSGAQGSQGQMEAIQFANQLASHQANQLLQIRALLIAQQNAEATRAQAIADREAREAAAVEQVRRGTFIPSTPRSW
jgi:P-type conjugative transfer protein TrbJ